MAHTPTHTEEDINLVEIWLRIDPKRWIAGVLAGIIAGLVMLASAMLISKMQGMDVLFPMKIPAVPFLGAHATEYTAGTAVLLTGLMIHLGISGFLGFVYAHFTGTNKLSSLLGVGITWGLFAWIFIFCLFVQSFRDINAINLTPAAAFFPHVLFGLSLISVSFFDRMIRKN